MSDTALTAYLARPDQRSYDLADLTLRYLRRELKGETDSDQGALFDERRGRRRLHGDALRPRGDRPVDGAWRASSSGPEDPGC